MDYNAIPIIKLEVQQLKHAVLSHIGAIGSDLGDALSNEIEKAIESYDWQGQVSDIVHKALRSKVENYFNHGDGSRFVHDAVTEGFNIAINKTRPIDPTK